MANKLKKAIKKELGGNKIRKAMTGTRILLSDEALKTNYRQVYFPGYGMDALDKVKNEYHIESDREAIKQQAKRAIEWFLLRQIEATTEGITIHITPKDLVYLDSI